MKKKKPLINQVRKNWGETNPVQKVVPNKKKYNRKKQKNQDRGSNASICHDLLTIAKELIAEGDYRDKMEVKMVMTREATEYLKPLLETLKKMGDLGSSREIKIEDWDDDNNSFYFDGDGDCKIESIEIDLIEKYE